MDVTVGKQRLDGSEAATVSFQFSKLRAAVEREHYLLHQAALEWSLDAPITIRDEQDILSRREWDVRFDPYAHQVRNLITFCRRAPVALLADDVGLGKTISAGLILSELMARRKVARTLIVAPKLLLPQWQEELAVKFNISAVAASGAEFGGAMRSQVPAVVTTYQSARNRLDDLKDANFDMIVLDEAHKLRNLHGTSKPPRFAVGIREALKERWFKYVLMLTATPIQNRLWDLYSLIDLLTVARGHANPFGTPEIFRAHYIEDSRAVQIKRGRRDEFRRHLSNYMVRTRRGDAKLVFPTRQVRTHRVKASSSESELFRIVGDLFNEEETNLNGLAQSSIGQALMSSPRALLAQLQEMARRGTVPESVVEQVRRVVEHDDSSGKLSGLLMLVAELSAQRPVDWRMVVFTARRQTQEAIGDALKAAGISVGFIRGAKAAENERAIRRFRESPPGVRVLVSTDAGAEGVNLQVANVLINYDLPWNPMVLEQRIGRIQRLASQHAEVKVLNLVLAGSVEEKVVARLGEKLQAIAESIGDIEAILETLGGDGSEEDPIETVIRRLVVESLKGMDAEEATRKALASIEEAKQVFAAERDTVERTLGDLNDLHRSGPSVPEITPIEPSIQAKDFVLRALKADGATVREVDTDVLSVTQPGQNPYRITFKERRWDERVDAGFFGSTAPRVFIPGKRDFERLSQSWSERSAALVVDRSKPRDDEVESAIRRWLGDHVGVELSDFEIHSRRVLYEGNLVCRASIANNVDRLEKLVIVPVRTGEGPALEPALEDEAGRHDTIGSDELGEELSDRVTNAVIAEPDLAKFAAFYRARLAEELPDAASRDAAKRITEQFTPSLAAAAVGLSGVRSSVLVVTAQVRIDGHGPFSVRMELIPQAKRMDVCCTEAWLACGAEGRPLPESATAVCAVTSVRAPKWTMAVSAVSGRAALAEAMCRCEVTGDLALPDEIDTCSVTGRRVRRDRLVRSPVSGRLALADACVMCSFTEVPLMPEETLTSDLSGEPYRIDERVTSVLSGRSGHRSEFVQAVDPEGPIARDEAGQSNVSGAWAGLTRLVASGLDPSRRGLVTEVVRCAVTDTVLLVDEAAKSEVSGKPAAASALVVCEVTKARTLPSELVVSEVSGKKVRFDQLRSSAISQRKGHESEFVRSLAPVGWIALDEAERSDLSGEWGSKQALITSERPPHRRGLPQEVARCDITGKRLLRDETGLSAVSGRTVDTSLLVESPASNRTALPEELVACQHTGIRLCPDELGRCEATGKLVDLRELEASQESGKRCLKPLMVRCAESGRRILPAEAVRCAVTGQMISRREAEPCAITGRLAARSRMASSPASGALFIDDGVTRGEILLRTGLESPLVDCGWSGVRMLATETVECPLSGLRIGRAYANAAGELDVQRQLLNGDKVAGVQAIKYTLMQWLRSNVPALRSGQDGSCVGSPTGKCFAACVRIRTGLLGLGTGYVAVVLGSDGRPCGPLSAGRRSSNGWEPLPR